MFFFFSSRRRHTRWNCDWSSDVCSSDLIAVGEWPEQDFACQAEDCGVDTEAQGQCRNGDNRENGTRSKRSQRSPDVHHRLASRRRRGLQEVRARDTVTCNIPLLWTTAFSRRTRFADNSSDCVSPLIAALKPITGRFPSYPKCVCRAS